MRRIRPPLLAVILALPLGGCWIDPLLGPLAITNAASLVLTGGTTVDHVASLVTGRNCSAVRIEQRLPWCAPPPGPPPVTAFCTRSLGAVDCWAWPPSGSQSQLADPPAPR